MNVSLENIEKIAKTLEIPISELFEEEKTEVEEGTETTELVPVQQ